MEDLSPTKLDFPAIRKWKQIDIFTQLAGFTLPFIIAVFAGSVEAIFLCYFTVGATQIISCIYNSIYLHQLIRSKSRKVYEYLLVTLIVIFFLLLVIQQTDALVMLMACMLLFGVVMAVWYFAFITLDEYELIKEVLRRKESENGQL